MSNRSPVLSVKDVSVAFGFDKNGNSRDGRKLLQVTDRVSFDIFPGEFFALVGESGCGKSVTAMSILRLLPWPSAKIVNGEILFDVRANDAQAQKSNSLKSLSSAQFRKMRSPNKIPRSPQMRKTILSILSANSSAWPVSPILIVS